MRTPNEVGQSKSILWFVVIDVQLTSESPSTWEGYDTSLLLWLFARNPDDAARRAVQITRSLPYEIASDKVTVGTPASDDPRDRHHMAVARDVGLSMALALYPGNHVRSGRDSKIIKVDFEHLEKAAEGRRVAPC